MASKISLKNGKKLGVSKMTSSKKSVKPVSRNSKVKPLKKFDEGGKQVDIKTSNSFETVNSGSNKPTAPKSEPIEMKLKTELVPANKILKEIKMPAAKAKLLPGGFTSIEQKRAYIKNVKNKISKGATIEQLVKDKVGTKAGLESLGLGKYARGEKMKKEGQALKIKGDRLKELAKNTDYKKLWNDKLMDKAAKGGNLTKNERGILTKKLSKQTWIGGGLSPKKGLSQKETKAYKNAVGQMFEKDAKPQIKSDLENLSYITPAGAARKGAQFLLTEGAKRLLKDGSKALVKSGSKALAKEGSKSLVKSGSQKLLNSGSQKLLNSGSKKLLNSGSQKLLNSGTKKLLNSGSQKLLNQGIKKGKEVAKKVVSQGVKKGKEVAKKTTKKISGTKSSTKK